MELELKYGDSLVTPSNSEETLETESTKQRSNIKDTPPLPARFLSTVVHNEESNFVDRLKSPLVQILGDTFLGSQDGQFGFILLENHFYYFFQLLITIFLCASSYLRPGRVRSSSRTGSPGYYPPVIP